MKKKLNINKVIKKIQIEKLIAMCLCACFISIGILVCIEPIAYGNELEDSLDGINTPAITSYSEEPSKTDIERPKLSTEIIAIPPYTPESIPIVPDPIEEYKEAAKYIAKCVWGEARGCSVTEQAAVIWCILNRVDTKDTHTGQVIIEIITAKHQFTGYRAKNPVTDEHYELALDVIGRWLQEKQGYTEVGRVLPKEYRWFAGWDDGRNHFRNAWRDGEYWDWSLESPYED